MSVTPFEGFPKEALAFFEELAKNNDRAWFQPRKQAYQEYVVDPAMAFVAALGPRLQKMSPGIRFNLKETGGDSIMRLNRDTRFGPDKRPYKEHLGIVFWEGEKKMEGSGFYFHLDPHGTRLYVGIHEFHGQTLDAYRAAVDDSETGPKLVKLIERLTGKYTVGGAYYKMTPRGFDKDHERAVLLRYNGLYAGSDLIEPGVIQSAALVDHCMAVAMDFIGLHKWLTRLSG